MTGESFRDDRHFLALEVNSDRESGPGEPMWFSVVSGFSPRGVKGLELFVRIELCRKSFGAPSWNTFVIGRLSMDRQFRRTIYSDT